jgi:tetratricopeptide (TPR) repeat protein
MNDRVKSLVQSAGQAAAQGRWEQAEQLWQQVRALDPGNAAALHSLGMHAFRRGDLAEAEGLLQAAHRAAPAEPMILLSLAHVLRERGDEAGEQRAIDASLVADAYFLPGLLARGNLYERRGRPKLAAEQFRNALKIAPPEAAWPPALRPQLEHARQAVEANARRLPGRAHRRRAGAAGSGGGPALPRGRGDHQRPRQALPLRVQPALRAALAGHPVLRAA